MKRDNGLAQARRRAMGRSVHRHSARLVGQGHPCCRPSSREASIRASRMVDPSPVSQVLQCCCRRSRRSTLSLVLPEVTVSGRLARTFETGPPRWPTGKRPAPRQTGLHLRGLRRYGAVDLAISTHARAGTHGLGRRHLLADRIAFGSSRASTLLSSLPTPTGAHGSANAPRLADPAWHGGDATGASVSPYAECPSCAGALRRSSG